MDSVLSKDFLQEVIENIDWNTRIDVFPDGSQFKTSSYSGVVCTGYAEDLAEHILPELVPETVTLEVLGNYFERVGSKDCALYDLCDGHDVCVVNRRYVLDPWPKEVEDKDYPLVYDWLSESDREKLKEIMGDLVTEFME